MVARGRRIHRASLLEVLRACLKNLSRPYIKEVTPHQECETFNATPPGSALVFEVRRSRINNGSVVQVFFMSQTLEQIRDLHPLTGAEHPSVAPVFVPGCSGPAPAYACSVEQFGRVVDSAIDTRFVTQIATGSLTKATKKANFGWPSSLSPLSRDTMVRTVPFPDR